MKQVSGKALARAVQRKGWLLARSKGSHHIFIKDGRPERLVTPIHGNGSIKIGLLLSQMMVAGLTEDKI